jgi:hypothetical protein
MVGGSRSEPPTLGGYATERAQVVCRVSPEEA